MKTFLATIGIIFLLIIGGLTVLTLTAMRRIGPLTAEAAAFVDEAVPAITGQWDSAELSARSAPELQAALAGSDLQTFMLTASARLGALASYDGATCEIVSYLWTAAAGETVIAVCDASAIFEKGSATFKLTVQSERDAWRFLGFFVTPMFDATSVQVSAVSTPVAARGFSLEISPARGAVGLTRQHGAEPGAGWSGNKIENIR